MNGTTIEGTIVRITPGGEPVGASIPKGTEIVFDTVEGSWLRLISAGGAQRVGYVNKRSVKIDTTTPPPPPPPAGKVVTNIITVYDDGSISIAPK